MDLGQRIRQARLEAGLSQRQLCGETITRNMLSQIENGSARPSMDTLSVLAARMGKSISFFLEEDAVTSPNQAVMERARLAWETEDYQAVLSALEEYRAPDPVFDGEQELLRRLAVLAQAEQAVREEKLPYGARLLEDLGQIKEGYCAALLERRRRLLLAEAQPHRCREVCGALPSLDGELRIRAMAAIAERNLTRAARLLDAAEDQLSPQWNFLRGEVLFAGKQYAGAAECYHRAETEFPDKCAIRLEQCYREMEDYKRAYEYACRQRLQAEKV